MAEKQTFTQEGYDRIVAELDELITIKRPEIAEKLKEARAFGDLSENAEYDAALDEQAETEERISNSEEILRTAVIVEETDESDDSVQTGRTVTIEDLNTSEKMTYKIVGTTEADPLNGKLSNVSLVGQHLLGLKAGDKVEFMVPDGMARYKVVEVKR
jgi:transcription elongation factor GreA